MGIDVKRNSRRRLQRLVVKVHEIYDRNFSGLSAPRDRQQVPADDRVVLLAVYADAQIITIAERRIRCKFFAVIAIGVNPNLTAFDDLAGLEFQVLGAVVVLPQRGRQGQVVAAKAEFFDRVCVGIGRGLASGNLHQRIIIFLRQRGDSSVAVRSDEVQFFTGSRHGSIGHQHVVVLGHDVVILRPGRTVGVIRVLEFGGVERPLVGPEDIRAGGEHQLFVGNALYRQRGFVHLVIAQPGRRGFAVQELEGLDMGGGFPVIPFNGSIHAYGGGVHPIVGVGCLQRISLWQSDIRHFIAVDIIQRQLRVVRAGLAGFEDQLVLAHIRLGRLRAQHITAQHVIVVHQPEFVWMFKNVRSQLFVVQIAIGGLLLYGSDVAMIVDGNNVGYFISPLQGKPAAINRFLRAVRAAAQRPGLIKGDHNFRVLLFDLEHIFVGFIVLGRIFHLIMRLKFESADFIMIEVFPSPSNAFGIRGDALIQRHAAILANGTGIGLTVNRRDHSAVVVCGQRNRIDQRVIPAVVVINADAVGVRLGALDDVGGAIALNGHGIAVDLAPHISVVNLPSRQLRKRGYGLVILCKGNLAVILNRSGIDIACSVICGQSMRIGKFSKAGALSPAFVQAQFGCVGRNLDFHTGRAIRRGDGIDQNHVGGISSRVLVAVAELVVKGFVLRLRQIVRVKIRLLYQHDQGFIFLDVANLRTVLVEFAVRYNGVRGGIVIVGRVGIGGNGLCVKRVINLARLDKQDVQVVCDNAIGDDYRSRMMLQRPFRQVDQQIIAFGRPFDVIDYIVFA